MPRHHPTPRSSCARLLLLAGWILLALVMDSQSAAQAPAAPDSLHEIQRRLAQQEVEIKLLRSQLEQQSLAMRLPPFNPARPAAPQVRESVNTLGPTDGSDIASGVRDLEKSQEEWRNFQIAQEKKKQEEDRKKQEIEEHGYEVGSDLNFKTFWKDGFTAQTANRDFRVHFGGRVHADAGWFAPDGKLDAAFPGQWNDGAEFRRLRVRGDGTMYEVLDWVLEVDFQTAVAGTTNHTVPTDAYLSLNQIPLVGALDAGHFKEPFSFDDYGTPDNYVILMERSLEDNAFSPARNMGLMLRNTALDNKVIWATGIFRTNSDNASGNAFDYGDGEYSYTSRVVLMPYYANEGRCWWIFGGAFSHRTLVPDDAGINGANASRARFAARMPIRVNSPNLVDTSALVAGSYDLFNLQTAFVLGPVMFQSEVCLTDVHDIRRGLVAPGVPRLVDAAFGGFYVQAAYLLTGEFHPIDRDRARMNRVRPNETYFFVNRGENKGFGLGTGAWEMAVRYDYLSVGSPALEPFAGTPGVANSSAPAIGGAGREQAVTLGLNWYLCPNARWLWNYSHAFRDVPNPAASGDVDALGTRVIFDF